MFTGYKVFFTKKESLLFIETLLISIRNAKSPAYVTSFTRMLHRMTVCWSDVDYREFKYVTDGLAKMKQGDPTVQKFMALKSKDGCYHKPRYHADMRTPGGQYQMDRWLNHIDTKFPHIAERAWGGIFDQMFTKMTNAGVSTQIVDELAHYFALRGVYVRPPASLTVVPLVYKY
jgi:hypothetical protein